MYAFSFILTAFCLPALLNASFIHKKPKVISLPLSDEQFYLSTSFYIDNEEITFLLDSGSSDTWVFNSDLCSTCSSILSTQNAGQNTSYLFETTYFGGQSVKGNLFIADKVQLSKTILSNSFYYGLIDSSQNYVTSALLGIAKPEMQSQLLYNYENGYNGTYPSLLDQIDGRNTYVVNLPNGKFSIGGCPKGYLSVPLNSSSDYYSINIGEVGVIVKTQTTKKINKKKTTTITSQKYSKIEEDENLSVILDTGASVLQLPTNITSSIVEKFNGSYWDDSQQSYMLQECPSNNDTLPVIVFAISDKYGRAKNIKLRGQDLVVEVDSNVCALAITPSDFGVMGIPFFRSGTVAIDLDNQFMNWNGLVR
ncbi:hypothetical protein ACO0SA_001716 [Hanseniaspora valbyensis]